MINCKKISSNVLTIIMFVFLCVYFSCMCVCVNVNHFAFVGLLFLLVSLIVSDLVWLTLLWPLTSSRQKQVEVMTANWCLRNSTDETTTFYWGAQILNSSSQPLSATACWVLVNVKIVFIIHYLLHHLHDFCIAW